MERENPTLERREIQRKLLLEEKNWEREWREREKKRGESGEKSE